MSLNGTLRLMNRSDKNLRAITRDLLVDTLVAIEVDDKEEYADAANDLNNAYLSLLEANEEKDKVKFVSGQHAFQLYIKHYSLAYLGKFDEEYAFANFLPVVEWHKFTEIAASIVKEVADASGTHDKAAMKMAWKGCKEWQLSKETVSEDTTGSTMPSRSS